MAEHKYRNEMERISHESRLEHYPKLDPDSLRTKILYANLEHFACKLGSSLSENRRYVHSGIPVDRKEYREEMRRFERNVDFTELDRIRCWHIFIDTETGMDHWCVDIQNIAILLKDHDMYMDDSGDPRYYEPTVEILAKLPCFLNMVRGRNLQDKALFGEFRGLIPSRLLLHWRYEADSPPAEEEEDISPPPAPKKKPAPTVAKAPAVPPPADEEEEEEKPAEAAEAAGSIPPAILETLASVIAKPPDPSTTPPHRSIFTTPAPTTAAASSSTPPPPPKPATPEKKKPSMDPPVRHRKVLRDAAAAAAADPEMIKSVEMVLDEYKAAEKKYNNLKKKREEAYSKYTDVKKEENEAERDLKVKRLKFESLFDKKQEGDESSSKSGPNLSQVKAKECRVCMTPFLSLMAFNGCGHRVICGACAIKQEKDHKAKGCIICRKPYTSIITVYDS